MARTDNLDTAPRDVSAVIARYKSIGFFGGLFLGAIVGVMVTGPNFGEWSWVRSLVTIAGSTAVGGLAGYIAGEVAVGGLAAGPGSGVSSGSGGHSDATGGNGGASDGGGGGDS